MDKTKLYSIKSGFLIAVFGTVLMLLLLALKLVGPQSVNNGKLMIGASILFISLYLFLLMGVYKSISNAKKSRGGKINFSRAFLIGALVSLSTAIFAVVFTVIFYELIYSDYNSDMKNILIDKLSKQDLKEVELIAKIKEQTQYYSTTMQAQFSFVGNLITGLAFSLIVSLFMKSKKSK